MGEGHPPSFSDLIKEATGLFLETLLGSPDSSNTNPFFKFILGFFFPDVDKKMKPGRVSEHFWEHLLDDVEKSFYKELINLKPQVKGFGFKLLEKLEKQDNKKATWESIHHLFEIIEKWTYKFEESIIKKDSTIRHIAILSGFARALIKGIIEDCINWETEKFNFKCINDLDFREWLKKHGASDLVIYSPVVRFFYMGTFSSMNDENQQDGLLAAGTALGFFLPALGYRGSFLRQPRLGTADSLVMPLYQVLQSRGVKFKFFHKVTSVKYSEGEDIESIELEKQVELTVDEYDPKIIVKGNPAWPNEPLYEQIEPEQVKELKELQIDLESPWSTSRWNKGKKVVLNKLKGDFDEVILGISIGGIPDACSELIENLPKWKDMVDNIASTQIISAQLYFNKTLEELGFNLEKWGMPVDSLCPNVVTYQNPLYSFLNESIFIENENWPEDNTPKMELSFTGPLVDAYKMQPYSDHNFPESQYERVIEITNQWIMDSLGLFFSKVASPAAPAGLDYQFLVYTDKTKTKNRDRFRSQYFIANINPSDRYVLAKPGTDKYRLKPYESGFKNLYLVGDWTDYGVNVGYMEGTIISAMQAVRSLLEKNKIIYNREIFSHLDVDWSND